MKSFIVTSCLTLLFPVLALAQSNLQNMQTSAVLDITAPIDFETSETNKMDIRTAELFFFGPLDSTFDGTLNLAAHNEDGEFKPEVHEAYLSSSKLIHSSRLKVGKYFLGVGQLNQFHQHDWAFVSAPRVQKEFFEEEAIIDSGVEFSTLLPFSSHWDLTLGVTNGYNYGHADTPGAKPQVPTHYIHPVNVVDFADVGALQWGLNYLGRTDAEGIQTQLYGFDFVFKKTESGVADLLLQSEFWYRSLSGSTITTQEDIGAYIYPQISFNEKLLAGVRIDLFKELTKTFASDGTRQNNLNYALVPTLTYKYSEHTILRTSYAYDVQTNQGESDELNQRIELQLATILEDHTADSVHDH